MNGFVLNRVGILGYFRAFFVLNRSRVSNLTLQPGYRAAVYSCIPVIPCFSQ